MILANRRGFLGGLLASITAPAIVRVENIMPVRSLPIDEIFLDAPITAGYGLMGEDPNVVGALDRYLLKQLVMEADQHGLQIRRPRFQDYVTYLGPEKWNERIHRRCIVDVVDAPWLRGKYA